MAIEIHIKTTFWFFKNKYKGKQGQNQGEGRIKTEVTGMEDLVTLPTQLVGMLIAIWFLKI